MKNNNIDPIFTMILRVTPKSELSPNIISYTNISAEQIEEIRELLNAGDTYKSIDNITIGEVDHDYELRRGSSPYAQATYDNLSEALTAAANKNIEYNSSGNWYVKYHVI